MWHFMSFERLMISALLSWDKKCSDINLKLQIMKNKILFRVPAALDWTYALLNIYWPALILFTYGFSD